MNEEDSEIVDSSTTQMVQLRCKEYAGNQNLSNAFFSNFKPELLFKELVKKLNEESQDF